MSLKATTSYCTGVGSMQFATFRNKQDQSYKVWKRKHGMCLWHFESIRLAMPREADQLQLSIEIPFMNREYIIAIHHFKLWAEVAGLSMTTWELQSYEENIVGFSPVIICAVCVSREWRMWVAISPVLLHRDRPEQWIKKKCWKTMRKDLVPVQPTASASTSST